MEFAEPILLKDTWPSGRHNVNLLFHVRITIVYTSLRCFLFSERSVASSYHSHLKLHLGYLVKAFKGISLGMWARRLCLWSTFVSTIKIFSSKEIGDECFALFIIVTNRISKYLRFSFLYCWKKREKCILHHFDGVWTSLNHQFQTSLLAYWSILQVADLR